MIILVAGGVSFIGSTVVRHLAEETDTSVANVDALTYAGSLDSLRSNDHSGRFSFEHVDRSIDDPYEFEISNLLGTHQILEAALSFKKTQSKEARRRASVSRGRGCCYSVLRASRCCPSTGEFGTGAAYALNSALGPQWDWRQSLESMLRRLLELL